MTQNRQKETVWETQGQPEGCLALLVSIQFVCSGSFYTGRAIAKLFYIALTARFNGCRARDSEKISALKPRAERERNTLPFTASSSICLHSLVYYLKNGFLIQTTSCMIRIAMAITLMGDKFWIDTAKGSAGVRGKNTCILLQLPWK